MLHRLLSCFKNLKMGHQTFLINFCLLTFTVLLILITYYIQSAIFFGLVQQFSQQLSQQQEENLVRIVSYELRQYISIKNQISIRNLRNSNEFFLFTIQSIQNHEIPKVRISYNQFDDCIEQSQVDTYKTIYNSDLICQMLDNKEYNEQAKLFNESLSLLTPFTQLFVASEETKISFLQLPISQIFASFPKNYKFKNFNPQTRPWYLNHMKQIEINPNQKYFFSPVFFSFRNNAPYFTISLSLKYKNVLFGIISQIQLISDHNIENIPLNIALVNSDGQIIFSTIESLIQLNSTIEIYDVAQTGFNETDWQLMYQIGVNNPLNSTTLYLENKVQQEKVYVNTFYLKKENLTLIVFKNITYEKDVTLQFENLVSSLQNIIIQQIYIQACCCFFLILITVKFIKIIFAPLLVLIETINYHVKQMGNNLHTEIFKMVCKTKKSNDIFSSLTYQFMAFKDIQMKSALKKNKLCQEIESIPYNYQYQEIDCGQIKQQFSQIPIIKSTIPKLVRFDSFKKISANSQVLNPLSFNCNDENQRIIFVKQILLGIFRQTIQ